MSLQQFIEENGHLTDKYTLGYVHTFYSALFEPRRYTVSNVLEIGIQFGHSIILWRDYFENAIITGVDVVPCQATENQERIITHRRDAYDSSFVNSLPDRYYDIVIDDGPHTYSSMEFFLIHYIHKVKSGGLLILEDIVYPSWTPQLLELIDPSVGKVTVHDMRNKQLDQKLLSHWSNGLDVIVVEIN